MPKVNPEADFADRVRAIIRRIPKGKVTSYGTVAALAGSPRAARMVGMILRHGAEELPWQRVINSKGIISIVNMEYPASIQAELLRQEGVAIEEEERLYRVDLQKYGWFG